MRRLIARSAECRLTRPADTEELRAMRRRLFQETGLVMAHPAELPELDGLLLTRIGERLYGKRSKE